MFLRCTTRKKNGKEHRYWSLVENRRLPDGRVVQRHVLYLGEINDAQERAWRTSIEVFQDGNPRPQTVALFPEDRGDVQTAVRDEVEVPFHGVFAQPLKLLDAKTVGADDTDFLEIQWCPFEGF